MSGTSWYIKGHYLLACSCDFGCPCNFNARPSLGNCQGTIGALIAEGRYGGVDLRGQKAFVTLKWPGAIHEGNGVAAVYVDSAASEPQREALDQIFSGAAGGAPWAVFAATWSHVLPTRTVPIEVRLAGKDSSVMIVEHAAFSMQPIRNQVTKAESYPKVVLPQGFVFKEGDIYALKEYWVDDTPELRFAHPGRCATVAAVHWQGP